jgi:hypothetical protein
MTNKKPDTLDDFDFGFSFSDEDIYQVKEISEKIQQERQDLSETVEELQDRIQLLHKSILPFLDNLCKYPEKSTIHWPDRVNKITQFKARLKQIAEGK